jgi:hypothetical protein
MDDVLEEIRSWLRAADLALSRRTQPTRTPKQRAGDFEEAVAAHRSASTILEGLQAQREPDAELIAAIAPLHAQTVDLGMMLSEIRFDDRPN